MTTIQIASDLHIEYTHNKVPDPYEYIVPIADVLVLAGDIGSLYKLEQLRGFLDQIAKFFQAVLYIPGNHEFYTIPSITPISYAALESRLFSLDKNIKNLFILNRSSVRIGNTCIVGCTLWTRPTCTVPPFIVRINGLNTRGYIDKHEKDLHYIKKMIKYCKKANYEMVVITHYPPSLLALNGIKKKKAFMSLYATDLDELLTKDNMSIWICGHTHKNFDFNIDGCRVVSNQKGKPKDRVTDYSKTFQILI